MPSGRLAITVIESTFVLLSGIGDSTERRWWETGIVTWSDFLRQPRVPGLSSMRKQWYDAALQQAGVALAVRNGLHFARCLRPRDHWRLFPLFDRHVAYLDIETTGRGPSPDSVTVVGLHRDGRSIQFIAGHDLTERRLNEALEDVPMLVSFFGSVFDVPFLKRVYPGLRTPPLHFDLCFAGRRLGLTGGLKLVEQHAGLARQGDLMGLDGWDAVRLWRRSRLGDVQALDRLLRYNQADTEHLVPLARHLYEGLARTYGPSNQRQTPVG